MVARRTCSQVLGSGRFCQAAPLREGEFCFWHEPEQAQAVAEARRLGGQRRRREGVVSGAYDFEGLDSVEAIRRMVVVAAIDTLQLENSVARNRALGSLAQVAARLLETSELEERLAALEAVTANRDGGRR